MSSAGGSHERVYRRLLWLYPDGFRARFGDEMVQVFGDQLREARDRGSSVTATWFRGLLDLASTAATQRLAALGASGPPASKPPPGPVRLLGLVGVLGGAVLIAAFLPIAFSHEAFNLRLVLFTLGAMAVAAGLGRRAARSARLVWSASAAVIAANAWYLAMTLVTLNRPGPMGAGDIGFVYFLAGAAMWLADAIFGIVVFRHRLASRLAGLALAVGSVLAFSGMDRLGLRSAAGETVLLPLSLAGIALNGIAWIVLGVDVAVRRIVSRPGPIS
jgi:hypothetical protein